MGDITSRVKSKLFSKEIEVHLVIKAHYGIDLKKSVKITTNIDTINIELPKPTIVNMDYDIQKTIFVYKAKGYLVKKENELEIASKLYKKNRDKYKRDFLLNQKQIKRSQNSIKRYLKRSILERVGSDYIVEFEFSTSDNK